MVQDKSVEQIEEVYLVVVEMEEMLEDQEVLVDLTIIHCMDHLDKLKVVVAHMGEEGGQVLPILV